MTEQDVIKLQKLISMLDVQSLNMQIRKGDEFLCELGDMVLDDGPGPQEIIEEQETRERLLKIIDKLPARQCKIIKMRFGFETGTPQTLEQIGEYFGVTRERIRQIEQRALDKLKWYITVQGKCHNINDF